MIQLKAHFNFVERLCISYLGNRNQITLKEVQFGPNVDLHELFKEMEGMSF